MEIKHQAMSNRNEGRNVVDITNSPHYSWGQNCDGWHFVNSENLSVIRETMPKGACEKLHYHERSQQFFYILAGEATIEIDGAVYVVKANQGISVHPLEKHKITNNTNRNIEFIVISSPVSHGDRINLE